MMLDETMLRSLLGSLAAAPENPDAVAALADYLYPSLLAHFKRRRAMAAAGVFAATGTDSLVYMPAGDRDQIAHDATVLTLDRLKAGAGRFDSGQGRAVIWVLRAAQFAFRDVVSDTYQRRRKIKTHIVDGTAMDDLLNHSSEVEIGERVARKVDLAAAIGRLPDDERTAFLMHDLYGYTHKEISDFIYDEETQARSVERLITNARQRLSRFLADVDRAPDHGG